METARRPLIYGEVLFDCFEDGDCILGGAPFNVAWHLQGFGVNPGFVSRVGRDDLGRQVRESMVRWGIDTGCLQEDSQRPTGRVRVTLEEGQPRFAILADQAYDHIDPGAVLDACAGAQFSLLYHGSLIARTDPGLAALERVRDALRLPVFLDINLRAPWWSPGRLARLLEGARWLKLNAEELAALVPFPGSTDEERVQAARQLQSSYGLECVVVTLGAAGALLVEVGRVVTVPAEPVPALVDTVGAGDGFSAVMILGLLRGWAVEETLRRANAFAAAVCARKGATAEDPDLYRTFLEGWQ